MPLVRGQDGTWSLKLESDSDRAQLESAHSSYLEAFPRYLTLFDTVFTKAREQSEFSLLWTLLGVRGLQDGGWDPYDTSLEAIDTMRTIHAKAESYVAKRHVELWIYGHIVEASEPYEILANLIDISQGGTFLAARFPPNERGVPQSPGSKIAQRKEASETAGMPGVVTPMREVWDRQLRNAIFHSDYSVHGPEVRLRKDGMPFAYGHEEVLTLVNRAIAYFTALRSIRSHHIRSYTEPKEITVHPQMSAIPGERAIVMVREEYGAIGLKHAWTAEELKAGRVPWRVARYTQEERRLADADPARASFPPRESPSNDVQE